MTAPPHALPMLSSFHSSRAVICVEHRLLLGREPRSERFVLPGGTPEGAEEAAHALVRELKEELGVEVLPGELVAFEALDEHFARHVEPAWRMRFFTLPPALLRDPAWTVPGPRARLGPFALPTGHFAWWVDQRDLEGSSRPVGSHTASVVVPFLVKQGLVG